MTTGLGSARQLYVRHTHPRVLYGPAEVDRLRLAVRRGAGKRIFAAMRQKVAPLVRRVLEASDLPGMMAEWNSRWDRPGTAVMWALQDMAMVGVLAGDKPAVEAVQRVLLALPAADRIVRQQKRWLSRGMGVVMPLAYDLLADRLEAGPRREFLAWAKEFFVDATLARRRGSHFKAAGGNIGMGEMLTGFAGLLAIEGDPGVPDLTSQREEFVAMLQASLYAAIGPEGYPQEDGGYGYGMGAELAFAVDSACRAGLWDGYRDCRPFARFGRALLHFVQPWGMHLSNTGDHGDGMGDRTFVLTRLGAETKDPTLLWLWQTLSYPPVVIHGGQSVHVEVPVGKGLQVPACTFSLLALGQLPKRMHPSKARPAVETVFRDTGRGIVTFRSGWDADDALVVFDGSQRGPSAQGHQHDSCGHFSLSALGEYFAIDTGRYNIEQSCHNVMLIDGQSGRSTEGQWRMSYYHGLLTDYQPGTFCDSAAVDSSHQHNCYWARRWVGLVKGEAMPPYLWTVDDINKANDWAEFWWQLHTSPENAIELADDRAIVTGWRKGNHLDVHFALPAPTYPKPHTLTLEQDVATPSSYKYIGDVAAEAAKFARPSDMVHHCVWRRPRLLAKVGGYNGRLMALCLPRRKGAAPATVERLPARDNVLAVRIASGQVEDTLIFAYEHNLLDAANVSARGQWCVVRRNRKTGKVLAHELGHGTRLTVAGKRVV